MKSVRVFAFSLFRLCRKADSKGLCEELNFALWADGQCSILTFHGMKVCFAEALLFLPSILARYPNIAFASALFV